MTGKPPRRTKWRFRILVTAAVFLFLMPFVQGGTFLLLCRTESNYQADCEAFPGFWFRFTIGFVLAGLIMVAAAVKEARPAPPASGTGRSPIQERIRRKVD